jgi:predicted nicotinamide N-methyase
MPARHHRQANGLKILKASDPRMRRLKRAGHEAEIHGHKVWNSSFLVMEHLKKHPLREGARVLEIGCGWGILGQFCARRFGATVHGTDADANVLPYLELHAEVNGVTMTAEKKTFEQHRTADLAGWDLVVGTDICFWDELGRQLYNLIRRARRAGAKQVIVADPGRPPFHELADRCEARLEDVQRREMHIARPVKGYGELLIVG